MIVPILLVLATLVILLLEVFFVSFGALTVLAVGCAVGAVLLAFQESSLFGWSLIGVLLVGGPLTIWGAFKLLPKLPFGRRFFLELPDAKAEDLHAAAKARTALLGAVGEALSPLRPSGRARFGGEPVQVITRGGMVPAGGRVKVVDVSGNRVVVEPVQQEG